MFNGFGEFIQVELVMNIIKFNHDGLLWSRISRFLTWLAVDTRWLTLALFPLNLTHLGAIRSVKGRSLASASTLRSASNRKPTNSAAK